MMTRDEFKEKWKTNQMAQKNIKNSLNNEVKDHLAGYWDPNMRNSTVSVYDPTFGWSWVMAQDSVGWIGWYYNDRHFGFSGRLLKTRLPSRRRGFDYLSIDYFKVKKFIVKKYRWTTSCKATCRHFRITNFARVPILTGIESVHV